MSIAVTMFIPPNGKREVIQVTKVRPEDEAWFIASSAKLSMEEVGGDVVMYADVGLMCQGEPEEAIELAGGRSCEDTLSALRAQCERMLARRNR